MSLKRLQSLAIAACAAGFFVAATAFAADAASGSSVREVCAADFVKFCPGLQARSEEGRACMRQHRAEFSEPCRTAIDARRKEFMERIKMACGADIAKFCNTGSATDEGPRHCLREHKAELSESCKAAIPNRDN